MATSPDKTDDRPALTPELSAQIEVAKSELATSVQATNPAPEQGQAAERRLRSSLETLSIINWSFLGVTATTFVIGIIPVLTAPAGESGEAGWGLLLLIPLFLASPVLLVINVVYLIRALIERASYAKNYYISLAIVFLPLCYGTFWLSGR